MNTIKYILDENPTTENDKIIREGIVAFNKQIIKEQASHFSIFAKHGNKIIGGALIWEHTDALYIDVLWCDENFRKQGIGSKIISMIDNVARNKMLTKIFVDTYEFQASIFYQKHGFYCIGTIPSYLLGYDRIFMQKDL